MKELVRIEYDKIVIIVRHAQADSQSREAKLTLLGIAQAEALAESIARTNQVNFFLTSTMVRATETAAILALRLKINSTPTDLLVEHCKPEPGDFPRIRTRALEAQRLIWEAPGRNTLVVTHGRFARTLTLSFFKQERLQLSDVSECLMGMENTGISIIGHIAHHDSPQTGWALLRWNDIAHLKEKRLGDERF